MPASVYTERICWIKGLDSFLSNSRSAGPGSHVKRCAGSGKNAFHSPTGRPETKERSDKMNYWDVRNYREFCEFAGPDMTSESRQEGVRTITLRNWRLVEPLLYTMVDMSHAIFRGVEKDTYSLKPSIFRRYAFEHARDLPERNAYIENCFNHFLEALRGRRGPLSKPLDTYNTFEIWSLGRHFGLSNTLLDWSHSPYVCLFFAFANRHHECLRSLFCLKRNVIQKTVVEETSHASGSSSPQGPGSLLLTAEPTYESLVF
jgi:hypothetical protein